MLTELARQEKRALPFYKRILPVLQWLPSYDKRSFSKDVTAGLTVGSFAVPEGMAYASLAGLPPQMGLCSSIVAQLMYFFFGTSRQLSIGPTSALSIMVAGTLGMIAAGNADNYIALASMTAILVGLISLVGYVLKLGVIPRFISKSVLTGFSAGAAFYVAASQLPKLFGIHGGHGDVFEKFAYLIMHLGETNVPSLVIGGAGILILLLGERRSRKIPWALIVVLASIAVMSVSNLQAAGIQITGNIPSGLPQFRVPAISWDDVREILPLAFSAFLLSYVEGMSATKVFATKNQYRTDANQELLALGAANVSAGLFSGYVSGGSMSRTAVSDEVGAKTPLYGLFASLVLAVVVMFLTGLFYNLPEPILASVVLVAIIGLFDAPELRNIYRFNRREFGLAMITFLGVLLFGMLQGVLVGVFASLLLVLWSGSNPHTAVLGRISGTDQFADVERHPENEQIQGILVYRVDAGIFFASAEAIQDQILDLVRERQPGCKLVVIDLETTPNLDYAGARMFIDLRKKLERQRVALRLSKANGRVRDVLRKLGVAEEFGVAEPGITIMKAIESWQLQTNTHLS